MSVWSKIIALAAKAFEDPPEPVRPPAKAAAVPAAASAAPSAAVDCAPDVEDVGFTAAVIGLAAKMAKADGRVSHDEVAAAAAVFRPPPGEEDNFRRVFNLAQQSVLGFDSYARQIGKRYRDRPCLLQDVLDGLFHIAKADGQVGPAEDAFLRTVAQGFGFSEGDYARIRAANLGLDAADPFTILGLSPDASIDDAQRAWRRLVQENHPDHLRGRGAAPAIIALAEAKTAIINAAFAAIRSRGAA